MSSQDPTPPERQIGDADLHEVEKRFVREPYKDFFLAKRQNFFATLQAFPDLWECFMLLDGIWMREFSDLERVSDTRAMVPLNLFMNAHAQFRTALEAGFSTRIGDAWNLLRSAIESTAYAAKIFRHPELALVWLSKDDGKKEFEAYKANFERNKKKSLFPSEHGLDRLHHHYESFSEAGTHTTVAGVGLRQSVEHGEKDVNWRVHYLEDNQERLAIFLYSLLDASAEMEKTLFNCFRDRLNLDPELAKMRVRFEVCKRRTADRIKGQFKLAPPVIWP